ncbi:hypothetical protein ABOM_012253 [Aspergillus bombycis]|uniref:Uncharacterized protein n=1 Tax=Aspergillus bombycis TaxID=109264 RepID=A0A1F7ZJD9_9EURO|nr:hypothetical protein ABOM_012253 [Aspergillus bombycis]OGM39125.1 hypothetical protein ABOM_012253 [Aspergillus bombycis]
MAFAEWMASNSSPDYKALYLRAEEEREREREERRRAEEEREREKEERRRAEENQKKAEEERDQGRERTRPTTFLELLHLCHTLFSLQLRAETPSRSTTGKILPPNREILQQEIYRSVCAYLAPPDETAAQLFSPRLVLEDLGQRFGERAISSEQDLESYERFGVENYVHDILTKLCKNPAAREEFGLGDGVKFDNHANALDPTETDPPLPTTYRRSRQINFVYAGLTVREIPFLPQSSISRLISCPSRTFAQDCET